jgi:hypothetical protein
LVTLRSVEEAIRAARERGEFDNLRGRGQPLDHTEYFSQPEELRLAHHLLRNAGFVPEEVELLREASELRERLRACSDEGERKRLARELETRRIKLDLLRGSR